MEGVCTTGVLSVTCVGVHHPVVVIYAEVIMNTYSWPLISQSIQNIDECCYIQYDSVLTPAESRNLNSECLLSYLSYDNHDVWHVLGAVALFFIFLMIMTLDDDLFNMPRKKIKIF